jgi:hypothetical protein
MTGQEVQAEQLMAMGGEAVAAIIAAGCGYPGDETDSKRLVKKITHVEADALDAIKKEASRVNFG